MQRPQTFLAEVNHVWVGGRESRDTADAVVSS